MRKINRIIIHSTATPEGRAVTPEEICRWHREAGKREIGYHYVIGLDGTVHNGRNSAIAGAHVAGYNQNSIGICYVGGVAKGSKTPKDTRTAEQTAALKKLIAELKKEHPSATICGHKDLAVTDCPSFDVSAWLHLNPI